MSKSTFMLASSLLSPKRWANNHCYAYMQDGSPYYATLPLRSPLQEERTDDRSAQSTNIAVSYFGALWLKRSSTCTLSRTLQPLYPTHHWHTSCCVVHHFPINVGNNLTTCQTPTCEAHLKIVSGTHLPPEPTDMLLWWLDVQEIGYGLILRVRRFVD